MAKPLDLEEQEQLDELKHFWKRYGNLITWTLIIVFGAIAAWNGWNYWQRSQAAQASAMYEEVERAASGGDMTRLERAFTDMKDRFGRTTYAHQAGLLAAQKLAEQGKVDAARAALTWVADKASDEGYQAVARLRLAGLLADAKSYDEALKQLGGDFPAEFEPLVADRRGDIYKLQGKPGSRPGVAWTSAPNTGAWWRSSSVPWESIPGLPPALPQPQPE
jgi:predicted negative regulator of RcsB-dependent stress response